MHAPRGDPSPLCEVGGEPSTVERPRTRARFIEQGERAGPAARGGAAVRSNAAALPRETGTGYAGRQVLTDSRRMVGIATAPLALALLYVQITFCSVFLIASSTRAQEQSKFVKI